MLNPGKILNMNLKLYFYKLTTNIFIFRRPGVYTRVASKSYGYAIAII